MVLDCAAGDCGNGGVCICWGGSGDAAVELAASANVRLADAGLLASIGIAGAVPNSVWRTGRARASSQSGMALPGSVQKHDTGGAGEVSESDAGGGWVRRWGEGDSGVLKEERGCPMSRRFCETWESGSLGNRAFPGLPRGTPFRYSVKCHRNCGNVRLSQTDITRLFYSAAVPENLHRTYGARDLHFLTFSCYQRRPLLNHASRCDLLLQILERVRRRYRLVVLGYVVMPEHVHLLVTEP